MPSQSLNTTCLLHRIERDPSAAEGLIPLVYDELRQIAARRLRRERPDHTLQPTALVHEAFLRLVDQTRARWNDRAHFLAVAAEVVRRVLVDHARAHDAVKRGGGQKIVTLCEPQALPERDVIDVLDLDVALERLAALNPRHADIVRLRFFGGLTGEEIGHVLGVSRVTVTKEWAIARAWLLSELGEETLA